MGHRRRLDELPGRFLRREEFHARFRGKTDAPHEGKSLRRPKFQQCTGRPCDLRRLGQGGYGQRPVQPGVFHPDGADTPERRGRKGCSPCQSGEGTRNPPRGPRRRHQGHGTDCGESLAQQASAGTTLRHLPHHSETRESQGGGHHGGRNLRDLQLRERNLRREAGPDDRRQGDHQDPDRPPHRRSL